MKKITLLGCSGSIGTQTIDILRLHPDKFELIAISAHSSLEYLEELINEFNSIKFVNVGTKENAENFKVKFPKINFSFGTNGLEMLAAIKVDLFINALVGSVGLSPTKIAIEANNDVAIANKETIVVSGKLILDLAKKHNVKLFPIDSEHSAILQCLNGEARSEVRKILLTGSGGPFRNRDLNDFETITKADALAHPNWDMGAKISIDSATMMNKGLEFIEAMWLFDAKYDDIEIVLQPESIIHSMVEYIDGSIMAHLGKTDMRIPIMYSLSYPERLENTFMERLNFQTLNKISFLELNLERYPCLKIALDVASKKAEYEMLPCIMNAANESAVALFLAEKIKFIDIAPLIEKQINKFITNEKATFEKLLELDKLVKEDTLLNY